MTKKGNEIIPTPNHRAVWTHGREPQHLTSKVCNQCLRNRSGTIGNIKSGLGCYVYKVFVAHREGLEAREKMIADADSRAPAARRSMEMIVIEFP
jgi:hypothetical protein